MTTLTTQLEALEKGGFSSEEINTWKQDKVLTLENAGFESDEILAEFGYESIDKGPIKKIWENIITLGKEEKQSGRTGISVNTYLWRASLDALSFMPLLSADPFGGVIITDWYSTSPASKEKFKVVTYILDKELRVDALKVSVFKRFKNEDGDWVDSKSSSILQNKVEDAILTKARKYKIQSINN